MPGNAEENAQVADPLAALIAADPDLAALIERWPGLSEPLRRAIVGLVQAVPSA